MTPTSGRMAWILALAATLATAACGGGGGGGGVTPGTGGGGPSPTPTPLPSATAQPTPSTIAPYIVENCVNQSGGNGVCVYAPPYTSTADIVVSSQSATGIDIPDAAVVGANGNIYVGNCGSRCLAPTGAAPYPDGVGVLTPPYASAPLMVTNAVVGADALALDASGDLFVANGLPASGVAYRTVGVYSPAPSLQLQTSIVIPKLATPLSLALDSSNNLFVALFQGGNIAIFAPPYTGMAQLLSTGATTSGDHQPDAVALDASGDLFVAVCGTVAQGASQTVCSGGSGDAVLRYTKPYTAAPQVINNGVNAPVAVALATNGTLFVANASNVAVYTPPYTGTPTIISGISTPTALAVDGAGNLYVATLASGIAIVSPPYSSIRQMLPGSAPLALVQ